jgi:hypothetical protein
MRICSGYHNGIGNWVVYTSILQALEWHSGNKVTLVLDDEWRGEVRDGIELLANNSPFIDKVISYQKDYSRDDYDYTHMSAHSVMSGGLYRELFGEQPDPNQYTAWAASFLGELDFYYLELYRRLEYKGPIFPQYIPYTENIKFNGDDKKIVVSNGYRRSPENRMASKSYPHWEEVMQKIRELHEDVKFILVGGRDDMQWGKEVSKAFTPEVCQDVTGKSNLLETAGILRDSQLVLTSDTGVYHLSDSLACPGVVVFSSTLYSKNYPINGTMIPIRSMLQCAPCQSTILFSMCDEPFKCSEAISPKYIISVVRKLLNERRNEDE